MTPAAAPSTGSGAGGPALGSPTSGSTAPTSGSGYPSASSATGVKTYPKNADD
jgi:hypothetical protein